MTTASSRVDLGTGRVTQLSVIRSEWIKLRPLRSTWYSLLATVVMIIGLGTLFSALRAHPSTRMPVRSEAVVGSWEGLTSTPH